LENSLDAGATSVEIRLKEFGKDVIEIVDNGSGVEPENYEGLTLKYHTSKLSSFSDLGSISSYGFRGEALSSLCALSRMTITTRTLSTQAGVKLEYDYMGKIVSQTPIAREVGTTVTMHNLFKSLPVRYTQFHKNIKKEYIRLQEVLHAYALVCTGVRIACYNQVAKGPRQCIVIANGIALKDRISTVFDPQMLMQLEHVENERNGLKVEGFISKGTDNTGRSRPDRQFFFINKRPVDLPSLSKLINQLYRSVNKKQYPSFILNLTMATDAYDVNVTPDKRKILIHEDVQTQEFLRDTLLTKWEQAARTFVVNDLTSPHANPDGNSTAGAPPNILHKGVKRTAQHIEKARSDTQFDYQTLLQSDEDICIAEGIDFRLTKKSAGASSTSKRKAVSKSRAQTWGAIHHRHASGDDGRNMEDEQRAYGDENFVIVDDSELFRQCGFERGSKGDIEIGVTLSSIKEGYSKSNTDQSKQEASSQGFSISVCNSNTRTQDCASAEKELSRVFKKEHFKEMKVVGQFNKGFIIGRLGNDLFIIDQHAADEKYNFEVLQKSTTIHSQQMLIPVPLSLTADEELLVLDNIDIFKSNGFSFSIDESAQPRKRVRLAQCPFSKDTSFGVPDVHELITMIRETPASHLPTLRAPRVIAMFASRACRKSVMVGTALNKAQMQTILENMSTMESPWRCPHGRPTMRHLVDISTFV
jgi:DNA mismatch repair protein PMS2